MWVVFALLSAVFAALTAILAKAGITGVNSNLATAVRTAVVLVIAWGVVFITGKHAEIPNIGRKSWLFLTLSGCATGLSWLFYYKALQSGEASKVVPIDKLSVVMAMIMAFVILGEKADLKSIVGGVVITVGALILAL
ncbi:MAG: EamA family transporter [Oscillospiraceae bacterium]|jgi:transporter family protein|nr:EamA family transporter [Oscillospiraceae bacterium]